MCVRRRVLGSKGAPDELRQEALAQALSQHGALSKPRDLGGLGDGAWANLASLRSSCEHHRRNRWCDTRLRRAYTRSHSIMAMGIGRILAVVASLASTCSAFGPQPYGKLHTPCSDCVGTDGGISRWVCARVQHERVRVRAAESSPTLSALVGACRATGGSRRTLHSPHVRCVHSGHAACAGTAHRTLQGAS